MSDEIITILPLRNRYLKSSNNILIEKEEKEAFITKSAIPGRRRELLGVIGNL